MALSVVLRHPCGVCGRPVAYGAHRCPCCGARGILMTHGPAHVGLRHWLVGAGIIVIPFIAAIYAAHGR